MASSFAPVQGGVPDPTKPSAYNGRGYILGIVIQGLQNIFVHNQAGAARPRSATIMTINRGTNCFSLGQ